jgi:polysaccharide biosynthesis/export protein
MRAISCLMLFLAAALALAACAQAPGGRGLYMSASAPAVAPGGRGLAESMPPPQSQRQYQVAQSQAPQYQAPSSQQPQGIDHFVYGSFYNTAAAPVPRTTQAVAAPPVAVAAPAVAAVPVAVPAAATLAYAAEGPYLLDSGDRLRIVVFGQDGLTNSYAVDASGHIDMPLIGSVSARGLTSNQLAARIADKLRQGFVREPHVAVEVEAYRPFFILGEVTQPGQYPYVANMDVETAVAIAGGFTPRAFRKTVIVSRPVNGQQTRMTVPPTFPLRPGDTVNVQERWF